MAKRLFAPSHNSKNNSYLISFELFPHKIIILGLILLLSLPFSTSASLASAASDEVKWSRFNIPAEGSAGNWVLADSSDVQHLTMAIDGTLYGYATPSGTSYTLFKSTDGGESWSYTGKVEDTIVDIAAAPDKAEVVYYATPSNVYRSTDGGSSFVPLPASPGGAGSNNIEITSIDVAPPYSQNIIAVGTRDTDSSQFGGIYILDEETALPRWLDTNPGDYDIYAIAFSPSYTTDWRLVAVATDESDTIITTKVGDAAWGATIGNARLEKDNSGISVAVATSADIAFPSDYDANEDALFAAIDTGSDNGDVYMITGADAPDPSTATDLNIGGAYGLSNVDVTSLAITGNAAINMLAGAAASAQVYYSDDGGKNWTRSAKGPTGQSKTHVLVAPGGGRAYAATSGTGSAFSITRDSGATWNQASLIDTTLSSILDLAPSPSYDRDNTLFILTWGGEHSLWRSLNGGAGWERVYSSTLANVDSISQVELSPQYGSGSQVVFLAGTSNGKSAIWQSKDNGQHFTRRTALDPDTVTTFNIDAWAVADDSAIFAGSFDGSNGLVYHTTNSGWTYSTGAVAGSQSLNSIVLSPDYEQDETILAGNTNGWVYWSSDNGISFEPLPPEATSPPLTGSITVVFDPEFSRNRTVYAASNTADKGVYRFIIDKSTKWESIDGSLPTGSMVSQPAAAADGTLYATNFQADGGMERSLNPTYSLGPKFETVTRGLDDGATLTGLWLGGRKLWSIDSHNTRLMTFSDTLTVPVALTSPSSGAPGIGIKNIKLEWETLRGATAYQWQLDYDTDFSTVPAGFEGETKASSARLPALELDTTYYWRVRATKPALSPWSTKWSFTTSLGYEATSPQLQSPEAGARDMPPKPIFQWSAVAGADSYELVLSTAPSLANPTIVKSGDDALPGTAWQCDVTLSYDTAYYWKVRAVSANTFSDWSAVGAFITEPPPSSSPVSLSPSPSAPPSDESAPLPPPPSQQTAPDWSIYLMWLMGLIIILLLIITLMLVMRIRRP